ncbi:Uncharacterised protein [Mammaliicoccus lentus]|uniref:hypothetical protein n=1 Tax=Mammaliicoccus lentus TaxID=42858 RepID=UPI00085C7571|nr:hypothetical protein [Mammaliicoccus lentus]SCU51939.1 Uncharacterised protein [Mammaliicoccus lentus]
MKKLLFLLFASLLVLGACGQKEETTSKEESTKKTESKDKKKDNDKKDKSEKEDKDKGSVKKSEPKTEEQQSVEENTTEQPTQEQQTVEQPVQQPQYQEDSRGNLVEQPDENGQYTGNELPADFTTEGMSPEAQSKIENLTRQKDFEGLSQTEYNRQVFEIMNNQ